MTIINKIIGWLSPIFSSVQTYFYAAIVLLFLALGGSWYVRGLQIENLRTEVSKLQDEVDTANARIEQARNAARIANERLESYRVEQVDVNESVSRARRQGGSNEEINNSVRDAINSINRMRGTESDTRPSGNSR